MSPPDAPDPLNARPTPDKAHGQPLPSILFRLLSDDLLRHTGILFSGMMLVHVCSAVFTMVMLRALPSEEFTLLAAFLASLTMIQRPLTTLNTGVSHYSSLLTHEGRIGDIRRLLVKWLAVTGMAAVIAAIVALVFKVQLAAFLKMNRTAPVVIMAAVFPALFCLPVLGGAVQGLQMFKWRAAGMSLGALARVGLGAGFVWFLYRACGWAMLGHGLGLYVSAAVLLLALALSLRGQAATGVALPSMRLYLLQSFFVQAGYAVLMTADVVMVKHFLPENDQFAPAATIGRLVVYLPGAIAVAMFPKVTSGGAITKAQRSVFLRSFGYTALCVAGGVLLCWLAPGIVTRIVKGTSPSDYLRQMVGLMGLAMGFSALLNILLQFLLAQRRFAPAYTVILFAGVYLGSAILFHATTWQIATASVVCNAAALGTLLLFLWRKNWFAKEAR